MGCDYGTEEEGKQGGGDKKKEKIGKGWNVGVDEELTMEERK